MEYNYLSKADYTELSNKDEQNTYVVRGSNAKGKNDQGLQVRTNLLLRNFFSPYLARLPFLETKWTDIPCSVRFVYSTGTTQAAEDETVRPPAWLRPGPPEAQACPGEAQSSNLKACDCRAALLSTGTDSRRDCCRSTF